MGTQGLRTYRSLGTQSIQKVSIRIAGWLLRMVEEQTGCGEKRGNFDFNNFERTLFFFLSLSSPQETCHADTSNRCIFITPPRGQQ